MEGTKLELKGFTKDNLELMETLFLRAGFCVSRNYDEDVVVIETLNPQDDWIIDACKRYGIFE